MSLKFTAGDLTIHRVIEQETAFLPALEVFPHLNPDVLAENRDWMRKAGALDADDTFIFCFQSYVVRTPHHSTSILRRPPSRGEAFWNAIATPTRCAAPRISPRPRLEKSAARAMRSAARRFNQPTLPWRAAEWEDGIRSNKLFSQMSFSSNRLGV